MIFDYSLAALVTAGLMIYLVYALLEPEKRRAASLRSRLAASKRHSITEDLSRCARNWQCSISIGAS
jgi:K+-transporting ATPase KdpF subunit